MKKTAAYVGLFILAMATARAGDAPPPLLEDTFQNGFNPNWALVSPGIEIVPEKMELPDLTSALDNGIDLKDDVVQGKTATNEPPKGNLVARFTAGGQMLAGPWVKPGDWKKTATLGDKLEAWSDYTLSFRFRAGRIPDLPVQVRGRAVLLRILWRVNPAEDNPYEAYVMEVRWDKRSKIWELSGPHFQTDGNPSPLDARDETGPAGGKADTNWHTFAVTVNGDTATTFLDGDFHARVRDTRIGQGVIALQSGWSPQISPECLDIDDIRVAPIGGAAAPKQSEEERRKAALARGCLFAYQPSRNLLYLAADFSRLMVRDRAASAAGRAYTGAVVRLLAADPSAKPLAEARLALKDGAAPESRLEVPPLRGEYKVQFTLEGLAGTTVLEKPLRREVFSWEGNTLGITEEVYPPFTPVKVDGRKVSVVDREQTMNGFGLWDSVVSQGRELLAGPMTVRFETADGEGRWATSSVALRSASPQAAVFAAAAESGAVRIEAVSTLEFDGCMKVAMALAPGKPETRNSEPKTRNPKPEITRLWIEIPIKDREAPLYHTFVDSLRGNPAGPTPTGDGEVWNSGKAPRRGREWQNSFCSYLWFGAEERGLAWFAENDRGWFTAKDGGKAPVQDLVREGDRLTLRVYLVNTPSVIAARHELVFGLQASPVKPMPDGWRAKANLMPSISGPVNPWGGLSCSYKGPYRGDWTVVDRICAAHKTGQLDEAWLTNYVAQYNPPPVQGTWNWADSIRKFVNKWAVPRRPRPAMVYAEEMAACAYQPPWWTFQDEWTGMRAFTQRKCLTDEEFRKGPNGGGASTTYPRSYQDYALSIHNEWLKRGVSLYWDNCNPKLSNNPRTTAAYLTENGAIQPAITLWNQREYKKRTWNLLQYWKRHQPDEIEWCIHRTNTQILPLDGWATGSLDLEWSGRYGQPFPPAEIRTTTMGRQTGVYGHCHRTLWGLTNPLMLEYEKQHPEWPGRATWGMSMVHELSKRMPPEAVETNQPAAIAARALEKVAVDFGYGTDDVKVHSYWADPPVLTVSSEPVKWIVFAKPATRDVMIVLASWSEKAETVTVTLDTKALGFAPGTAVEDAENGKAIGALKDGALAVDMPPVYGVRVLRLR